MSTLMCAVARRLYVELTRDKLAGQLVRTELVGPIGIARRDGL